MNHQFSVADGLRNWIASLVLVPGLSLVLTATAHAGLQISLNQPKQVSGTQFQKGDLFAIDGPALVLDGLIVFDGVQQKDLSAVDRVSPTKYWLTANDPYAVMSVPFLPEDIVEYNTDTDTATYVLKGVDHFNTKIDGLHRLGNGNLLLSTEFDFTLNSVEYKRGDIFEYNIASKTAAMYLDGSNVFPSDLIDVNSITFDPNGNLLFTTDVDTTVDGLAVTTEQVVAWDGANASIFWDGEPAIQGNNAKITALMHTPEPSGLALILLGGLMSTSVRRRRRFVIC